MTQTEALMLALDYLSDHQMGSHIVTAIKEALAQPEQEPVAYLCENAVGHKYFRWKKPSSTYKPIALYTTPPQRTWVDLTEEEIYAAIRSTRFPSTDITVSQSVIEAFKEKNK